MPCEPRSYALGVARARPRCRPVSWSVAVENERIHASVWLRLRPFEEAKLDRVIQRLADRHHTHRFLPHLTVCGPTLDPSSLDAAARYARTSGLLPLTVAVARIAFA